MRRNLTKLAIAMGTAGLLASGVAVAVQPSDFVRSVDCDGIVGPSTIRTNVVVRAGKTCQLRNVTVNGNILVEGGVLADPSAIPPVAFVRGGYLYFGAISGAEGFSSTVNGNIYVNSIDGAEGALGVGGPTNCGAACTSCTPGVTVNGNLYVNWGRVGSTDLKSRIVVNGNVNVTNSVLADFLGWNNRICRLNVNTVPGPKGPQKGNLACALDEEVFLSASYASYTGAAADAADSCLGAP
jgi:hypothetical protein